MENYTQAALDELVSCEKTIVDGPKKNYGSMLGSRRNGMIVEAGNGRQFSVFMRQSEAFAENFSIGLQYLPKDDEPLILLRCNGPHGMVAQSLPSPLSHHVGFHIHRATQENIEQGLRPEKGAEITTEFASYKDALKFFLNLANIKWTEKHFPGLVQPNLFDGQ